MKKLTIAIITTASLLSTYVYADPAPKFSNPQDGVAYYQKDFEAAIQQKNYQKALADTYVLQDYLAQIYVANPE